MEKEKKPNGYWTKERVFEEARKYKTKKEFCENCSSAYTIAGKKKYMSEMGWFENCQNPNRDPIYSVYCYKFKEYNTIYVGLTMNVKKRNAEHHNRGKVYEFAKTNNIVVPDMEVLIEGLYQKEAQFYEDKLKKVSEYTGFNVISIGATGVGVGSVGGAVKKWTENKIFEEARKYKTKKEFMKKAMGCYSAAKDKGLLSKMDWFEELHKPNGYWSDERIFEEARKYRTRNDFYNGSMSAYQLAWQRGLLDKMDWFEEVRKPKGYWTVDKVTEEAGKYATVSEFQKNCPGAYTFAWKNKIVGQLFPKKQTA